MKPSALKPLFSFSLLSFHVVQKLRQFQLMQRPPELSHPGVIARWQFILYVGSTQFI